MNEKAISSDSLGKRCGSMARRYDKDKETQQWHGPAVVFGLSYEFVKPGETLLDIGIGTGLGSLPFHQAGLRIRGMDVSPEMLAVCGSKGFADELKAHDLTVQPYPYPDESIHHAVCVGVLNHFENLRPVFAEVSRILKSNGIFGIIVTDRNGDEGSTFEVRHAGSRHIMFRHGGGLIRDSLTKGGFSLLKEFEFNMPKHGEEGESHRLKAYIARRQKRAAGTV